MFGQNNKNMSNIKLDIKKIVSENLQKTRKEIFDDAFKNAHNSINENEFIFPNSTRIRL